jgi:PadR family transcriptional regulator PadR
MTERPSRADRLGMAIAAPSTAPLRPASLLRPHLLLLLGERSGHGYELSERLVPLTGAAIDTAIVYRALNAMEDEGLVVSRWERSSEGPVRRCHSLTSEGRGALARWARELAGLDVFVAGLLERLAARGVRRAA